MKKKVKVLFKFLRLSSICFGFIFLSPPPPVYGQKMIDLSIEKKPLSEVLTALSKSFDVSFSYDADVVNKYTISQSITGLSLEKTLLKLLRETSLGFEFLTNENIILSPKTPAFSNTFETIICGEIIDALSGESLPFANISLKNTQMGTTSDENGHFSLQTTFTKDDIIEISYIGYQLKKINVTQLLNQPCGKISLQFAKNDLLEIIVHDSNLPSVDFASPEKVNATRFDLSKIESIGGQVEKDVLQTLQLLPGVTTESESTTNLNIRGGTSGQNLVLFDDITMYHFGHFFGKVSAINSNVIGEVSFFKESFKAKHGGRVASVIDIQSKDDIPEKTQISLETSLLSGNAAITIPLFKQKAVFSLAYRRSFTDFFQNSTFEKLFEQVFQNSRISDNETTVERDSSQEYVSLMPTTSFSDVNAKILLHLNKNNHFEINFLQVGDKLTYDYLDTASEYFSRDSLRVKNTGFNANWVHKWHPLFSSSLNFSLSDYEKEYLFSDLYEDEVEVFFYNFNRLQEQNFTFDNHWENEEYGLDFGYQFVQIAGEFENILETPWDDTVNLVDNTIGITHTLFSDYHFKIPQKLHFSAGARFSHYNLTNKLYFEPRFFVKIHPFKNISFKLAGGIYYQTINQLIETNELNAEDHLWVLARNTSEENIDRFSEVRNSQYSFGMTSRIKGWNVSLGIYEKSLTGITARGLRGDVEFADWVTGTMFTRGLELSLQKKEKYFYTMISYTLGEVKYLFEEPEYPVPASYDELHSLNILQGFKYKDFTLSMNWKFGSGKPYSGGEHIVIDDEDPDDLGYWIDYEVYNKNRLEAYHRLDLSLVWQFKRKRLSGKITLSALNLYGRTNYLQRTFQLYYPGDDDDPPIIRQIDREGLPFTPNLGFFLRFE